VPADVYPLGRLDFDSEGLLLLTNDKSLNYRILHPAFAHEREYWVQVEGAVTQQALARLNQGVSISIDGKKYTTKKTRTALFNAPPPVPERNPPIRFRKNIPVSWISLTLTEGKNRQVRKMTAAVGFPTLRLIRYRVSGLNIESMLPGDMVEMDKRTCYQKLGLGTLI
jgi:23S rRNA pseudouridine2457 synthase